MIDINTLKVGDIVKCISNNCGWLYDIGEKYTIQGVNEEHREFLLYNCDDDMLYWYNTCEDFELYSASTEKQLIASSKNFTITINGDVFKVEAIGLSEEKINKIMDILCK